MSRLTHQIDALGWYGEEVQSVMCMTEVIPQRMEGETLGVIVARMKSGALAQLSINWATRSSGAQDGLWCEFIHVTGAVPSGAASHSLFQVQRDSTCF